MDGDVTPQTRGPELSNLPPDTNVLTAASGKAFDEVSSTSTLSMAGLGSKDSSKDWQKSGAYDESTLAPDNNFYDPERGGVDYRPVSAMNDAEVAARGLRGLTGSASLRGVERERGLQSQEGTTDGGVRYEYSPAERKDGLTTLVQRPVDDGSETSMAFSGRSDGLLSERSLDTTRRQESEQFFDPSKRSDGLAIKTAWKQGDYASQTSSFDGRADGLQQETIDSDAGGGTRTREYGDGRKEVVTVDTDGHRRSEYFGADGKPMNGDQFREQQKAYEASLKADRGLVLNNADEFGAPITLDRSRAAAYLSKAS